MTAVTSWTWNSGCCTRPSPGCEGSKTITLDHDRLVYSGFCADAGFGGGYGIGSQTINEFLSNGPLDEDVPPALAEDIRNRLS